MKRRAPLLLLALALLVVVVWAFHADAPTTTEAVDVSVAPSHDAGLKVHIDPNTGEFVDTPTDPDAVGPPFLSELNMSYEGLVEEDGPVSGKMVNLQGRFQQDYTGSIGADGKLTAGCNLPNSAQNDTSDSEKK